MEGTNLVFKLGDNEGLWSQHGWKLLQVAQMVPVPPSGQQMVQEERRYLESFFKADSPEQFGVGEVVFFIETLQYFNAKQFHNTCTDRQRSRQTEGQTDRGADRQTDNNSFTL